MGKSEVQGERWAWAPHPRATPPPGTSVGDGLAHSPGFVHGSPPVAPTLNSVLVPRLPPLAPQAWRANSFWGDSQPGPRPRPVHSSVSPNRIERRRSLCICQDPARCTSWGKGKAEGSEEKDEVPVPGAAQGPRSGRRGHGTECSVTRTVKSPGSGAGLGVRLREKEEKNLQKREAVLGGVGQETERSRRGGCLAGARTWARRSLLRPRTQREALTSLCVDQAGLEERAAGRVPIHAELSWHRYVQTVRKSW